jgi:PAS domain S-box-containing protein
MQASVPEGEVTAAMRSIYFDPSRPGRALDMVLTMPNDYINEHVAVVRNLAIFSAIAVSLIAGVIFFAYLKRVFSPLHDLTVVADQIGAGKYDTPMPDNKGGEMGAFLQAFKNMLGDIEQREEKILTLNKGLDESERYSRLILETVPEAIIVVDDKGRIIRANQHIELVFGYTNDEIVGQNVELLIPDRFHSHHEQLRNDFMSQRATKRMMGSADSNLSGVRKDGVEIRVEVGLGSTQLDGKPVVIASVQDVTKRKEMEQAIRDSASELKRSNKELEQFAYVASHDLQEPLRMVGSYMMLLERRYRDQLDDEAREFIDYAVDGTKRMQLLINDLLDFSRIGRKEMQFRPVDLNDVMKEILHDLQLKIQEEQASVEVGSLATVAGDHGQIRQVLQNLVNNALKFHGEQAPRIEVTVRPYNRDTDVVPEHVNLEHGWWVSVKDNGVGFKPEYAEQIFEIFKRLHNREQFDGTGIGLAICRKIIERHGGHVLAESTPGQGSAFHVLLPAVGSVKSV